MKEIKYPNLRAEMAKCGENYKTIAALLGITYPTVWRKMTGIRDWTIGEVEIICEHYNKNYYELFK